MGAGDGHGWNFDFDPPNMPIQGRRGIIAFAQRSQRFNTFATRRRHFTMTFTPAQPRREPLTAANN
jgi:hypothetical protein